MVIYIFISSILRIMKVHTTKYFYIFYKTLTKMKKFPGIKSGKGINFGVISTVKIFVLSLFKIFLNTSNFNQIIF